jgi:hypothetical protein
MIKMGDETIDRVLHDLKVVSAIRENDKLYTDSGLLNLDHGGISSSVYRYFKGENRNKGVSAINNILSDAFAIAENGFRRIENRERKQNSRELRILKLQSYHLVCKVRLSMADSLLGLKNLRATYELDTSLTARIDVIRERVAQGLKELDASILILRDDLNFSNPSPSIDTYPSSPNLSPRFSECLVRQIEDRIDDVLS